MKYFEKKNRAAIVLSILNLTAFMFVIVYSYGGFFSEKVVLYTDSNCKFCEETIDEIKYREFANHVDLSIRSLNGNSLNKRSFDNNIENCDIPLEEKGVPLLVTKDKCVKGKADILEELERLSIQD